MSNLTIFFDESGKNNDDKPHLMGALAIPDNVYNLQEFEELLFIVTQKEIHWKDFKGDSKEREIITKIIKTLLDHQPFIKMNVINYDQSMIQQQLNFFKNVDGKLGDSTIYMKFPERLIYGLLRNYGRHSSIDTKILIEEATEYKKSNVKLREQLPRQLNMQAIYRGENFKVTHSDYKTKGEAIGLEMTDILLGIVRTIIKKSAIRFSETKSAYTTDYIFFERYSVL